MIEFKSFNKIPRIENTTVIITEKLDGTNALIYVSEDKSTFKFGSRSRWIPGVGKEDNAGFMQFCLDHLDYLKRLDPGYHYGEFVGPGIQKNRYDLPEKRLFMFDTRLKERFEGCNRITTVPLIAITTLNKVGDYMTLENSYLNDKRNPEGLMVYIPQAKQYIKIILDKQVA